MRTRLSLSTLVVLLAGCSAEPASQSTSHSTALDGHTFQVKVVPDAAAKKLGENEFTDSLIFASGRFRSSACEPVGYAASPYSAVRHGDEWTFESRQHSEKDGDTLWKGTVRGSTVAGTLAHTRKDGAVAKATFSGGG